MTVPDARRRGAELALSLINKIENANPADLTLEADYREGRPQKNLMLHALAQLNDYADSSALEAFAEVMTSYLGSTTHHCVPTLQSLRDDFLAVRP